MQDNTNNDIDLYSDEVHDIFKRSSLRFQFFCFLWLMVVLAIGITSLLMIKISIQQETVQESQITLQEKDIYLYELFRYVKKPF